MKNIFLKFKDEAEATSILFNEDQASIWPNTDVIGIITKQVGEDEYETLEGFHVNLAANECPEELLQYQVFPESPSRVFGGLDV